MIRDARSTDAAAMAALIAQLNFTVDEAGVVQRLDTLARVGEPVLVAEENGEVVGLLDWHVMTTIHRPCPVGRIVALVVDSAWRGRGTGRALVEEAERRMTAAGCEKMEVTSNMVLVDAHRFYEGLGLKRSSYRFAKDL